MSMAPATSNMVARMQAVRSVSALEPTLVPKLLATSLAPTPNANRNETRNATTTIQTSSGAHGSITGTYGSITATVDEVTKRVNTERQTAGGAARLC